MTITAGVTATGVITAATTGTTGTTTTGTTTTVCDTGPRATGIVANEAGNGLGGS